MNSYEDLVKGRSLDTLLREAKEDKISLCESETTLVSMKNREVNRVDFLSEIERLFDYFNLCMPVTTVYSHLKKLQETNLGTDINPDMFLANVLVVNGYDIHCEAEKYIDSMESSNLKRGFVIRDKVIIVHSDIKSNWRENYFNDRFKAFPIGSIGEIFTVNSENLFVQFSFPPKTDWPNKSKPDEKFKKWFTANGSGDNARYDKRELHFVPINLIEAKRIKYEANALAKKIDDFARARE